jgi:hypothetical protein
VPFSVERILSSLAEISLENSPANTTFPPEMSNSPTPNRQLPSRDDQPHQELDVQTLEHRLDTQTLDYPCAFLRLDPNQSVRTIFERQVISLDVSDNEAEKATLIDNQICLLNLRHVARHHGFNLQQIHPDAFPSNQNIAASSDKPSISSNTPKA